METLEKIKYLKISLPPSPDVSGSKIGPRTFSPLLASQDQTY